MNTSHNSSVPLRRQSLSSAVRVRIERGRNLGTDFLERVSHLPPSAEKTSRIWLLHFHESPLYSVFELHAHAAQQKAEAIPWFCCGVDISSHKWCWADKCRLGFSPETLGKETRSRAQFKYSTAILVPWVSHHFFTSDSQNLVRNLHIKITKTQLNMLYTDDLNTDGMGLWGSKLN
jgi:hypothetical protein